MASHHPAAPKISDLNLADPMFEGLSVKDYDTLLFQVQMITQYMGALNPKDTAEARIRWFHDLVEYCYTYPICMLRLPPLRRAILKYFEDIFVELAVENPALSIPIQLREQLNRMYEQVLETNLKLIKDARYRA